MKFKVMFSDAKREQNSVSYLDAFDHRDALAKAWKVSSKNGFYPVYATISMKPDEDPCDSCDAPGSFFEIAACAGCPHLHREYGNTEEYELCLLCGLPFQDDGKPDPVCAVECEDQPPPEKELWYFDGGSIDD